MKTPIKTAQKATVVNIQALRAIAALLVVCVHASTILEVYGLNVQFLRFGHSGVDIFFVISGFIMVYTTRAGTTPGRFMLNRFIRVAPFYYVITFFVFGLVLVAPSVFQSTEGDWTQLIKSVLFIPFEKSNGLVAPTVFVGWTLNYEMAFYVLFAVSLFLPKYRYIALIAVLTGLVLLNPFAENLFSQFYTNPIIIEFAAGMVIAMNFGRVKALKFGILWFLLGFVAIIFFQHYAVDRAIKYGLPAVIILIGALSMERQNIKLSQFKLLGDASYSIYLTHFFVTQAVTKIAEKLGGGIMMAVTLFLLSLLISSVVGIFVHKIVEKPLVNVLKSALSR